MDEHQDPGYYREEKNEQTGATGAKIVGGCGLGCLGLLLICLVVFALGVFATQRKANEYADRITSDKPVEFVYPEIQMHELEEILLRYDNFVENLENRETATPLILSAEDINILINHHDHFSLVEDRLKVAITNNEISAEIGVETAIFDSYIPSTIPFLRKALKGKFINGEAKFDIGVSNTKWKLYIRDFRLADIETPEELSNYVTSKNWLGHINLDPKFKKVLKKISEIKIENNLLYIKPSVLEQEEQPELDTEPTPTPETIEA